MKTKKVSLIEKQTEGTTDREMLTLHGVKEIMKEEGTPYTDDELKDVLQFVTNVITITTAHYERKMIEGVKIIDITTNTTHEATSISLHPGEYGRTG